VPALLISILVAAIGVPLSRTSDFAGVSGAFQVGAGPNLTSHQSIVGECFFGRGLPPNRTALQALSSLTCAAPYYNFGRLRPSTQAETLYALTANYMYHKEGRRYGLFTLSEAAVGTTDMANSRTPL